MSKGFISLVVLIVLGIFVVGAYVVYENRDIMNNQLNQSGQTGDTIQEERVFSPTPTVIPTLKASPSPNLISVPTKPPAPTIPPLRAITVSGFAYEDRTDDGIFNSDDPGLANMQFYFFDTYNSQQVSTTYSNSSGNFSITLQVRGNLLIRPTNYNNFVAKSSDKTISSSQSGLQFRFRSASAPVPAQNIGILEGNIYHDANRNRSRDSGEANVHFYKLYLKDGSGNYFNTIENAQTTDAGGHFKYMNIPVPGTYTLQMSNPTGAFEILQPETTFSLSNTVFQNTNIEIPVYKY